MAAYREKKEKLAKAEVMAAYKRKKEKAAKAKVMAAYRAKKKAEDAGEEVKADDQKLVDDDKEAKAKVMAAYRAKKEKNAKAKVMNAYKQKKETNAKAKVMEAYRNKNKAGAEEEKPAATKAWTFSADTTADEFKVTIKEMFDAADENHDEVLVIDEFKHFSLYVLEAMAGL